MFHTTFTMNALRPFSSGNALTPFVLIWSDGFEPPELEDPGCLLYGEDWEPIELTDPGTNLYVEGWET